MPVTISVGVAAIPAGRDRQALIAAADEALYEAKRPGRNRVAVHSAPWRPPSSRGARSNCLLSYVSLDVIGMFRRMKRAHAPGLVMLGIVAACGCRGTAGLHGAAAPAAAAGEEAPAAAGALRRHHAEAGGRPDGRAVMSPRRRPCGRVAICRLSVGLWWSTGRAKERWIDAAAAVDAGYTLMDLRDDWTPYIFAEQHAPDGAPLPNRYRRVFIGLANDQLDSDGEPLRAGREELPGAVRHLPVAVGAARALRRRTRRRPATTRRASRCSTAVETVTYVPPDKHRSATSSSSRDPRPSSRPRARRPQRRHAARAGRGEAAARRPR